MPDKNMLIPQDLFDLQEEDCNTLDDLSLEFDFGPLDMKSRVEETFDDLIARRQFRFGPLCELRRARLLLRENAQLEILNHYSGEVDAEYFDRLDILLSAAGFTEMRLASEAGARPMRITARKRPLLRREHRYKMQLRELVLPADVAKAHQFAQGIFTYKGNNYDFEVARQFDLHSDNFAIVDSNGEILALARLTWRAPGYYTPFMYAVTTEGEPIEIPVRFRRLHEIMMLSQNSRPGAVAFKLLSPSLFQYAHDIAHFDSSWSTYEAQDQLTGRFYNRKYTYKEYGSALVYGDFGGLWNLIYTDEISWLSENRDGFYKS
jgi:hypothetical protein